MIVKNKKIVIDDSDIFANDALDRKDSIDNLSQIISTTDDPFVLSIDADWGAGKTTFVRLLKAHLEKEYSIQSIYFSAWEEDYSKEPLVSILGKINKHIDEKFPGNKKLITLSNLANKLTARVITRGISAFVKGSTGVDAGSGISEVVTEFSEKTALDLIESYKTDEDAIKKFKSSIGELLSSIDSENPFVIFVDELDRCRPLYSIELLERVKHLFNIDKLIFILSIDKEQLSESIKSQYGNIDTDNYLRRFIDLEYRLKNPNKDQFCDALFLKYDFEKDISAKGVKIDYGTYNHVNMMKYIAKSMDLSLREIEQVFIHLSIFFKVIQPRLFDIHFRIFILLAAIKIKNSNLYLQFVDKKINYEVILNKLFYSEVTDDHTDMLVKSTLMAAFNNKDELKKMVGKLEDASNKKDEKQQVLIDQLNMGIGDFNNYKLNDMVNTIKNNLDFSDQFNLEIDNSGFPLK